MSAHYALSSCSTWSGCRAQSLGLSNCRFQEGDATDLRDLEDDRFDLVVSIFGAMFAPKPFAVAKEAVRVTRPGGRIVMGNWLPNDPTLVAQLLMVSSWYSPPPPEGFISPMTWGVENDVIKRFAAAGVAEEKMSFERSTYTFNFPGTPPEFLAELRHFYGPTMNAFEAAAADGREAELQTELEALFNSHNTSPSLDSTSIPATFLRVTVGSRSGRELARWRAVGDTGLTFLGFPRAAIFGCRSTLLFQLPPIEPCMRFSRTRLTDALHRRCSATRARQA